MWVSTVGEGNKTFQQLHKAIQKWAAENGYKEPLSIDRIDPNGNYEPENCRWVTRKQQDRNKRDSIFVWIHGEHLNLMDAAEKYYVSYGCLKYRYHKGIRGEKLISPSQRGRNLNKYNAKSRGRWHHFS